MIAIYKSLIAIIPLTTVRLFSGMSSLMDHEMVFAVGSESAVLIITGESPIT
jgi:hypothetical protein